jgi:succinoglycan biosynthesis transport protein ExoP
MRPSNNWSNGNRSPELELSEYTTALRKRWYVIALAALIGGGIGFADAKLTDPTYQATAKVYVAPAGGETVGDLVQGSTYAQKLVLSYAELATMPIVLEPVAERLDLDTTSRELARSVSAATPLDTFIIEIAATSGTPEGAASLANAVANQLGDTVSSLSPGAAGPGVDLTTVSPADPPEFAFAPNTRMITATGLALGLALGVLAAIAMALLDTRVRTAADIARVTAQPVLGVIPHTRGRAAHRAAVLDDPSSPRAEAHRRLQTNLRYIDASGPLRSMVVTSAVPGEGKSTTALNLALAVAEKGQRVLLIDADLRRPTLASQLGIEGAVGLTTVLIGAAALADVVQPSANGLDVLPAGEIPPNPSQLIDSPAMAALIAEASGAYDLVIIDTPPLLPVADASALSKMTDGALLVAGCHRVRRHQLQGAVHALETVGAHVLGVVATGVKMKASAVGYSYASSAPPPPRQGRRSRSRAAAPAATLPAATLPAATLPAAIPPAAGPAGVPKTSRAVQPQHGFSPVAGDARPAPAADTAPPARHPAAGR